MYIYVNGEIVQANDAKISVFDHGFMYGLGVFETFRIYEGHPFLVDDHFQRLRESIKQLSIHWDYNQVEIIAILRELLEKNNLTNAYVRWNVSAGVGPLGLQVDPYEQPSTIVYVKPLPEILEYSKRGVLLETKRNSPEGTKRLKSHHYLNNIIGKKEIGPDAGVEGIFLTKEGHLAEGIVSNLFWVKNNIVYTPAIETGILNGVTRHFVLTLLDQIGIEYKEGYYSQRELLEADEAFVTNSIQEIVSLRDVDEKTNYNPAMPIATKLRLFYQQLRKQLNSRRELPKKEFS
ncbi:aminodeoxychorismate lyase [Alkalihalobacterium alkalinitrilicum]|uniref:aminodeoxychorismate lyase n=1 Tax=Alkalihalobacterium alkalinitrilicum TaxID=427920 RepID=UPI000995DC7F|nr:aminodeoxychorismate lyase [Alkalihalobacterium alkalinitrilicum]